MLRARLITPVIVCIALLLCANGCTARSPNLEPPEPPTRAELDAIVAPIALYPDPLLQRVLTASTFPDQIVDAALFIEHGGAPSEIPEKAWERSVKYVANYPSVLAALAEDIDATIRIGTAFTDSPDELRDCIQAFRRRAREHGNLTSSSYQTVIEEGAPGGATTTIRIEPTDPNVLYTPTTSTTVIYESAVDPLNLWAPLASFGLGVAVASAFDHDDYYYYGGPFYGPGFWYGGPVYRRWYDYRHDRWHHAYDYGRWHQDEPHHREDWARHRHDLDKKHSEWREARQGHTGGYRGGSSHPDGRASFRPPPPDGLGRGQHRPPSSRSLDRGAPSHSRATADRSTRLPHGAHRGGGLSSHGSPRGGGGRGHR